MEQVGALVAFGGIDRDPVTNRRNAREIGFQQTPVTQPVEEFLSAPAAPRLAVQRTNP
jgi:hypothetical protein